MTDFDVVVAGAGPAGCLLARELARAGCSVLLCDPRGAERLGRGVIIEIEHGACEATSVEPPRVDEIPYHGDRFRVFTSSGAPAFDVRGGLPATAIYLDRFNRRLLERAQDAGVQFRPGWRAVRPKMNGPTVVGAIFDTADGPTTVRSRLLVDATGFSAALLRRLDLPGSEPRDDPRDVVRAATRLSRVDPDEARRAVRDGRQGDGEVWTWLGRLGNYSTEFRHLSTEQGLGYMLVGYKAEQPPELLEQALSAGLSEIGGVGEPLHGDEAPIRIGHTRHRLAWDGFAVVGEAARMVVPATGSGVASAMVGASLLARIARVALKDDRVTTQALHPWAAAWHRQRGAAQAGIDAVRIAYDGLPERRVAAFLGGGFAGPEDVVATTCCDLPPVTARAMARRVRAVGRSPGLLPSMARMGGLGGVIVAHHRRYPRRWDREAVQRWGRWSDRLFGRLRGERRSG